MYKLPIIEDISNLQKETRTNIEWKRTFEDKLSPFLKGKWKEWCFTDKLRNHYITPEDIREIAADLDRDILLEKLWNHEPVKWLVHKYESRVLLTISYTCAANCWFCERQDRVWVGLDKKWMVKKEQADEMINYIKNEKSIREVIFSGWDPMLNLQVLEYIVKEIAHLEHLKFIRIHSKKPIQSPNGFLKEWKDFDCLEKIVSLSKNSEHPKQLYFSVHINCIDELFPEVELALKNIDDLWFKMLNQNVFLKWINDDTQSLKDLYEKLSYLWVRPYYIYHCQKLPTTDRYIVPIETERRIMSDLKQKLPWHCVPEHIIDIQWTTWKISVPHWYVKEIKEWELLEVLDFEWKMIDIQNYI